MPRITTTTMTTEALDLLRGRYIRLRGKRSNEHISWDMDVHENTLAKWLHGGCITPRCLRKIAAWCDAEEGKGCGC